MNTLYVMCVLYVMYVIDNVVFFLDNPIAAQHSAESRIARLQQIGGFLL